MKKTVLRLVSNTFVDYLRTKLPPSGQPALYHWQAECNVIIDSLDELAKVTIESEKQLTPDTLAIVFDKLFTIIAKAHTGNWVMDILCQFLRLEATRAVDSVLSMIHNPPKTIGSPDPEPIETP